MEMSDMVRVRFRRPYLAYKTGQVIELPGGQAHSMQLFGRVDIVAEPQLELAVAAEPIVERAVAPAARAPRRRKAKA
jgi:hypothetical protein